MVTTMKKITFLVYHKEYMDILNDIRELGILHVIEKNKGGEDDTELESYLLESAKAKETIKLLTHYRDENAPTKLILNFSLDDAIESVDSIIAKKDKLNQQKLTLQKEAEQLSIWGDFKKDSIDKLKDVGYNINFYTCPGRNFQQQWIDDFNAILIADVGSNYYFITISKGDIEIDAEKVKLPNQSLSEIAADLRTVDQSLQELDDSIKQVANHQLPSMERALSKLNSKIEFTKVVLDTESYADSKVMLLEGWIPADKAENIEQYFESKSIYYEVADVQPGENPPVQLKNNWFSKLFEPITKIFSLPNYGELDLTPYLAPFFILFFGFCTGDAGYGLLIILICLIAKWKMPKFKDYCNLGLFLGGGAILFGILSGTFFGIELAQVPALAKFRDYFLSMDNLMTLSIVLGGIQVMFGMCLNAANLAKQKGFKYAIGRIGWIFILLSLLVLVGFPELKIEAPKVVDYFSYALLGTGALGAVFYNSPDSNIFLNIGLALWNAYNMATGVLGDLLSYIRLFALGLTGGILGNVFNQLSVDMSPDIPGVKIIVMILILLVGHTIAFILTILGAFIHPLRLTFVEFYKNAGFEGGGKPYKPFKK